MRSDMAKVLCDEPRHGMRTKNRKGSHREDKRVPMDEKPHKEKGNLRHQWLVRYYDHKEFGDHVQPLRRFMLSCVGRQWNDVYSEIRKTIPKGTVVNNHVYTHLFQFVCVNVYMVDNKPYDGDFSSYRGRNGMPVYQDTYVHPETGIICKTPERPRRRRRKQEKNPDWIGIDATSAYYRKDGIWYICKFSSFPTKNDCSGYDVMYSEPWRIYTYEIDLMGNKMKRDNRMSVLHHYKMYYGVEKYCYQKLQIGKNEIKKLRNLTKAA